mgnify:CR=1 FL=1
MRSRGDNLKIPIGKRKFATEFVFCDICGSGNYINKEGVIVGDRIMDFCSAHTEDEIISYIEMGLPPYSNTVKFKKRC